MSRNKLYWIVSFACLAGYIWIIANELNPFSIGTTSTCLLKHATGIPCPSCGATRSVLSLLEGDLVDALNWNPLGFILAAVLLIAPIMLVYDLIKRKRSLHTLYRQIEETFKLRWVAIPSALLMLGNWIWNIYKGL